MRIRFLTSVIADDTEFTPNQVVDLVDGSGWQSYLDAGYAIKEGPAPGSAISTLYSGAGYEILSVDPTGRYLPQPGSNGGFRLVDSYHAKVFLANGHTYFVDLMRFVP